MRRPKSVDSPWAHIGERLRLARKATGMDQVGFARKAGMTKNAYNQWERGKRRPNIDYATALCDAHGLTLDWIYRGDPAGLASKLADKL